MPRHSKIARSLLNDSSFNCLLDDAQLVLFRLWVHPHVTALGTLRASIGGLAGEMYWPLPPFTAAFQQLADEGWVQWDETAHWMWLPPFLKDNPPESPNVVKSWSKLVEDLPTGRLKENLIHHVRDFAGTLPLAFQRALPAIFLNTSKNFSIT